MTSPSPVPRLPVVFVLDTSGEMGAVTTDEDGNRRSSIDQLNRGLTTFMDETKADYKTFIGVDVLVITFGGPVEVKTPFTTVKNWNPGVLAAGGYRPMHEAIVRAVDVLQEYRTTVRDENLPLKTPMIWVLTISEPTDRGRVMEDRARDTIRNAAETSEISIHLTHIGRGGGAEALDDLASVAPSSVEVRNLQEGMYREFFRMVAEKTSAAFA